VLERSFAASARMNLRFNNDLNIAEFASDLLRLIECRRDFASRRCYVESLQQLLGLIFVDIHLANCEQSGIARGKQISKDFSFVNWLALPRPSQLRWRA
jgi:hypothetical protein